MTGLGTALGLHTETWAETRRTLSYCPVRVRVRIRVRVRMRVRGWGNY